MLNDGLELPGPIGTQSKGLIEELQMLDLTQLMLVLLPIKYKNLCQAHTLQLLERHRVGIT